MSSLFAQKIQDEAQAVVEPILEREGFELVDLEYHREKAGWVLRLYADKEGGINIDDCAKISNWVGDVLEVKDIIPGAYTLEVSSPGLDRPLKKEKDFLRALNKMIRVETSQPIEGRKNFKGILRAYEKDSITVECGKDELYQIPLNQVARTRLNIEF
jgi:ribosome maturation factor RimP